MLEASPLPFPPLDADEPKAWPALLVVMVAGTDGAGAGVRGGGGGGSGAPELGVGACWNCPMLK